MRADVSNSLYRIYDPREVPLRFWRDGFYRLAARVECSKCGGAFVQIIRAHRYRSPMGLDLPTVRHPDPNDERIMSSFMAAACKNGVGNPTKHSRECPVGRMPKGRWLIAGTSRDR